MGLIDSSSPICEVVLLQNVKSSATGNFLLVSSVF
jgi:hypothetical protein